MLALHPGTAVEGVRNPRRERRSHQNLGPSVFRRSMEAAAVASWRRRAANPRHLTSSHRIEAVGPTPARVTANMHMGGRRRAATTRRAAWLLVMMAASLSRTTYNAPCINSTDSQNVRPGDEIPCMALQHGIVTAHEIVRFDVPSLLDQNRVLPQKGPTQTREPGRLHTRLTRPLAGPSKVLSDRVSARQHLRGKRAESWRGRLGKR